MFIPQQNIGAIQILRKQIYKQDLSYMGGARNAIII